MGKTIETKQSMLKMMMEIEVRRFLKSLATKKVAIPIIETIKKMEIDLPEKIGLLIASVLNCLTRFSSFFFSMYFLAHDKIIPEISKIGYKVARNSSFKPV